MKLLTFVILASSAFGQAPVTVALPTVPMTFSVHYLGPDTVTAKYGHKLPKTIFAASVTGVNAGTANVTFGQGFVLQSLRAAGYPALSQQDAQSIVLQAQGLGIRGKWNKYSPIGVKICDDIVSLQVFKVIQLSPGAAGALVTGCAVAKATQADISTILADIYQTYATDGIQPLMQLAPGGSIVGTLLFESEGAKAPPVTAPPIAVQVPIVANVIGK